MLTKSLTHHHVHHVVFHHKAKPLSYWLCSHFTTVSLSQHWHDSLLEVLSSFNSHCNRQVQTFSSGTTLTFDCHSINIEHCPLVQSNSPTLILALPFPNAFFLLITCMKIPRKCFKSDNLPLKLLPHSLATSGLFLHPLYSSPLSPHLFHHCIFSLPWQCAMQNCSQTTGSLRGQSQHTQPRCVISLPVISCGVVGSKKQP